MNILAYSTFEDKVQMIYTGNDTSMQQSFAVSHDENAACKMQLQG